MVTTDPRANMMAAIVLVAHLVLCIVCNDKLFAHIAVSQLARVRRSVSIDLDVRANRSLVSSYKARNEAITDPASSSYSFDSFQFRHVTQDRRNRSSFLPCCAWPPGLPRPHNHMQTSMDVCFMGAVEDPTRRTHIGGPALEVPSIFWSTVFEPAHVRSFFLYSDVHTT